MAAPLSAQGKLEEAEPLYREALDGRRATLGNTQRRTLLSINNLAALLKAQGKLDHDCYSLRHQHNCSASSVTSALVFLDATWEMPK